MLRWETPSYVLLLCRGFQARLYKVENTEMPLSLFFPLSQPPGTQVSRDGVVCGCSWHPSSIAAQTCLVRSTSVTGLVGEKRSEPWQQALEAAWPGDKPCVPTQHGKPKQCWRLELCCMGPTWPCTQTHLRAASRGKGQHEVSRTWMYRVQKMPEARQ